MSVPLIVNGVTFQYPQQFDKNWGPTLTNWSTAVTNALQTTSNNFTLLTNHSIVFKDSEVTPKSLTLTIPSPLSATYTLTLPPNAGSSGQVLRTDGSGTTTWVNAAGGGTINSGTTGQLAYYPGNGTTLSGETMSGDASIAAGGVLTISALAIDNSKVATSAAIAVTKLAALTASKTVVSDGSGFLASATTSATEIGYVAGVTSAIQTQLNTFSVTPTGVIQMYAGSSAPSGWLLCDGSVVSQTTYAALFAVCSTTFNTGGEGAGNFRLPTITNNAPVGAGSLAALGAQTGAATHAVSTAELPVHTPTFTDPGHVHTLTDPGHGHSANAGGSTGTLDHLTGGTGRAFASFQTNGGGGAFANTNFLGELWINTNTTGAAVATHTTGITMNSIGSGTAMSLVQPSIGLTFIIKT